MATDMCTSYRLLCCCLSAAEAYHTSVLVSWLWGSIQSCEPSWLLKGSSLSQPQLCLGHEMAVSFEHFIGLRIWMETHKCGGSSDM